MAKYIIDIPDNYLIKSALNGLTLGIPMLVSSTQKEFTIPTNLRLDLYTKPDRKTIEDEVWGFVRELIHCNNGKGMTDDELQSCFGYELYSRVFKHLTYSKAKARYDAWKKQKDDKAIKQKVVDLAEEIGVHRLYAIVREIRGE